MMTDYEMRRIADASEKMLDELRAIHALLEAQAKDPVVYADVIAEPRVDVDAAMRKAALTGEA